ncbi:MAG: ABC transporter ATP-binding protein [Flavisolibacter sp.]|nr:ABC transporter ATP-binding protein [Flavisolibacter sp.]
MKRILKNTWAVLDKGERRRFMGLIMLDVLISIVDVFSLLLLLWIIQFYIQPDTNHALDMLPSWLVNKDSVVFIALFFLLFSLKNIAGFAIAKTQYTFSSNVAIRISGNNLSKYQHAGFEEFVHTDSSEHIRKMALQPFEFCQHILTGIQQIITQSCLIVITVVAIVWFKPQLFVLLTCILLPPVTLIFYLIKKRITAAKLHIRSSNEASLRYLLDALKGYVEANIFNRNRFFLERFIDARRQFSTYLFDLLSIQNLPSRLIEIFAIMGLFVLIAIAKWTGDHNGSTLLTIGAFMAAAYKVIPGMVKIINISGQIKVYEFSLADLDQNKEDEEVGSIALKEIRSIELKNVYFQYAGTSIFSGFRFVAQKGDFIGVTGRSGKGKTTLLNILLGFLSPYDGGVCFNGIPINPGGIKTFWPSIAYVRQQTFLIHDTILRNITFEKEGYHPKRLACALKISGLEEVIAQFPEGLEKMIAENGKNISGGQQQRIALARALYKNADVILLDEPFNELDEASEISLLEHFRNLASQGKIVIMSTHDKKSLSYCTKTISLDAC